VGAELALHRCSTAVSFAARHEMRASRSQQLPPVLVNFFWR